MQKNKTIIVIPARMGSTRLPNKPLAQISGRPMIAHVIDRAIEAEIGEVVVACDHPEVKSAAEQAGAVAVLTDPNLPSGSDRVWQAVKELGHVCDFIINLQGDEPLLNPVYLKELHSLIVRSGADIGTLVAPITDRAVIENPNVVKAVLSVEKGAKEGKALYFSRQAVPHNAHTYYHHIGLYAYKYGALEKFVSCTPSPLEKQESLEQLRALENGLSIYAGVVEKAPKGIDTQEDLEKAREILK